MNKIINIAGIIIVLAGITAAIWLILAVLPERVLIGLILLVLLGQFVNARALKQSFTDLVFAIAEKEAGK